MRQRLGFRMISDEAMREIDKMTKAVHNDIT